MCVNEVAFLDVLSVAYSGQDGTVRLWGVPDATTHYLQQTCVFTRSNNDDSNIDGLDAHLLEHVCWSPSGRFIAGAMDTMINVWSTPGACSSTFVPWRNVLIVLTVMRAA